MTESRREAVWTVAAWLGIMFGALGVLVSLGSLALVLLFVVGSWFDAPPQQHVGLSELLSSLAVGLVPLLSLLVSASCFGAGLGLLRRRLYGRTLTLVFGPISIITAAGATMDLWQNALSRAVNGPPLADRVVRIVAFTPLYVGYVIAIALLCWSVYLHREAFERKPSEGPPDN